jgi:hypothetical protein
MCVRGYVVLRSALFTGNGSGRPLRQRLLYFLGRPQQQGSVGQTYGQIRAAFDSTTATEPELCCCLENLQAEFMVYLNGDHYCPM